MNTTVAIIIARCVGIEKPTSMTYKTLTNIPPMAVPFVEPKCANTKPRLISKPVIQENKSHQKRVLHAVQK